MMIYLTGFMVMFAFALVVYALWPKGRDDGDTIKRRMAGRSTQSPVARVRDQAKESVAKRVMEKVTPLAVRPGMVTNAEQMSKLRIKLTSAGLRSEKAPVTFLASKTVSAVLLGAIAAAYCWAKAPPMMTALGIVMMGAGFGFLAPEFWLKMAIRKRSDKIRRGLPDTLDMLVISVESGLGLDAALQRVGEEMHRVHPTLSEELQLINMETQMGIPRSEALDNFAARSGVDEAKSLVGVVNQAERFGTSVAQALRRQSAAQRVKRRQAAEEMAQKTTVKLMVPLILFIFPAIMVVLAGPAALKAVEMFSNN